MDERSERFSELTRDTMDPLQKEAADKILQFSLDKTKISGPFNAMLRRGKVLNLASSCRSSSMPGCGPTATSGRCMHRAR